MRFAIPDSDDEDLISLDYSFTSDDNDVITNGQSRPPPRSALGKNIRSYIDTSESEVNSEDEVDLLGGGWDVVNEKEKDTWREPKPSTPSKVGPSKPSWRTTRHQAQAAPSRIRTPTTHSGISDLRPEEPSEYDYWLKSTESAAMRTGHELAVDRRRHLREITANARAQVMSDEDKRVAREEEEMMRMLKGMETRQKEEEEEMARRFDERKRQLWADIDAAIKVVEKKEAEVRAAAQAAVRRKQEEDAARATAAEKEAAARRAEAERLAKEQMAEEARAREAQTAAEQRAGAEREEMEERNKATASRGLAGGEWRTWVEKQKKFKTEVIEVVKADRAMKTGLRTVMRLITRGLGQVVNTREGVMRVTSDIHNILCGQLSSSPFDSIPSAPPPKPYAYLISHLSKALIKQAESEVSAKADAAFPLARVVMLLLLRGHSPLGDVLFARFVKKCPWVVPFYPAHQANQPRDEYEKSTGRGADEPLSDYISRMAGIYTLYLAILQTPLASIASAIPSPQTPEQLVRLIPPILRFPASWTWLAFALRDPLPALAPTAQLVTVWIEIVGAEAIRLYSAPQVGKVFDVIMREGLEGGKLKGDSEATRQRLKLLLEGWRENVKPHPAREWT